MTITPEEAFNAVKILCPSVVAIGKGNNGFVAVNDQNYTQLGGVDDNICWGSLDRWPVPLPQYREPTENDVGVVVECSNNKAAWEQRKLLAVLPESYSQRFILASTQNDYEFVSRFYARIRIDEPAKPAWLPDGWRVLGEDEVIKKGDKFYNPDERLSWAAQSSIGNSPAQHKKTHIECEDWTWIRRIEQLEIYHHNGKKYRMAEERDVGKLAWLSDIDLDDAVSRDPIRGEIKSVDNEKEFKYRTLGLRWRYAFVEVKE